MTLIGALRNGPRTQPELARILGTSVREVQSLIQSARLDGSPICSGDEGVWLALDSSDLKETEAALRRRALQQLRTFSAIRRTRKRMEADEAKPLAFFTDIAA